VRPFLEIPTRSLTVAAAALVAAVHPGALGALMYDRAAILSGELWRVLTGHLVHAGGAHLAWDVTALIAVGVLFERALGSRYWMVLLASALTITSGLMLFDSRLAAYCGLSGVLNGLWVAGALAELRRERSDDRRLARLVYRACLVVLGLKLAVEGLTGTMIFTEPSTLGAIPVPHAHLLGALGGLLFAFLPPIRDRGPRHDRPAPVTPGLR
jgi:rhomboid family GlyGly-CTERM serine protease